MKRLREWTDRIAPPDEGAREAARRRWNTVAKPLGSLGLLETAVEQVAALTGDPRYTIERRALLVLCADNGVVARGVSQTGSEVTAAVTRNLAAGDTAACHMARLARCEVVPVDMGVKDLEPVPGVLSRRMGNGTADITLGPAMEAETLERAVLAGIELVGEQKARGVKLLATGEMGIGNTTTAGAVASVLLGAPPAGITGKGAGLSGEGLKRKVGAIETAIAVNQPDPRDPLDVLRKLGGFDLAGMAGVFLGGGVYRVPVLIDGFISAVAALCAARFCPAAKAAMLASHCSAEPGGLRVLEALGKSPPITAGMRLGEGTGALAFLPLLDMAWEVYLHMSTFDEVSIAAYQPL